LDFRTNNPGTLREIFCNANVLAAFVQKQGEKEAVELECARKKSERSIEQQVKANEVRDNFVPVKSAMFAAGGGADWYKKFNAKELVAAANTLRAVGAKKNDNHATRNFFPRNVQNGSTTCFSGHRHRGEGKRLDTSFRTLLFVNAFYQT